MFTCIYHVFLLFLSSTRHSHDATSIVPPGIVTSSTVLECIGGWRRTLNRSVGLDDARTGNALRINKYPSVQSLSNSLLRAATDADGSMPGVERTFQASDESCMYLIGLELSCSFHRG